MGRNEVRAKELTKGFDREDAVTLHDVTRQVVKVILGLDFDDSLIHTPQPAAVLF